MRSLLALVLVFLLAGPALAAKVRSVIRPLPRQTIPDRPSADGRNSRGARTPSPPPCISSPSRANPHTQAKPGVRIVKLEVPASCPAKAATGDHLKARRSLATALGLFLRPGVGHLLPPRTIFSGAFG